MVAFLEKSHSTRSAGNNLAIDFSSVTVLKNHSPTFIHVIISRDSHLNCKLI